MAYGISTWTSRVHEAYRRGMTQDELIVKLDVVTIRTGRAREIEQEMGRDEA